MASSGYLSEAEAEALTAKGLPKTLAKHPFYGSTSSGAELEGAPPGKALPPSQSLRCSWPS